MQHFLNIYSPLDSTENYDILKRERQRIIDEKEARAALYHERNKKLCEDLLEERIQNHMKITDSSFVDDIILYDDEPQLPKLTPAMEVLILYFGNHVHYVFFKILL